jgi:hypothetical protein
MHATGRAKKPIDLPSNLRLFLGSMRSVLVVSPNSLLISSFVRMRAGCEAFTGIVADSPVRTSPQAQPRSSPFEDSRTFVRGQPDGFPDNARGKSADPGA